MTFMIKQKTHHTIILAGNEHVKHIYGNGYVIFRPLSCNRSCHPYTSVELHLCILNKTVSIKFHNPLRNIWQTQCRVSEVVAMQLMYDW